MQHSRRLEILAEAVSHYSGYVPGKPLYQARNPGGLKAYKPEHQKDEHGNRVFLSFLDGLQALLWDLELKIRGTISVEKRFRGKVNTVVYKAKSNLNPTKTLIHLALAYNLEPTTAQAWSKYLRLALNDQSITPKTELRYFIEESGQ